MSIIASVGVPFSGKIKPFCYYPLYLPLCVVLSLIKIICVGIRYIKEFLPHPLVGITFLIRKVQKYFGHYHTGCQNHKI